jgi:hypothetical protein
MAKMRVADVDGLTTGERLQGIRQLARLRHACPVDQNRDDSNVAGKRRRDFDRNEIIRMVEPSPAALVFHAQPVGTDDDQNHIARSHLAVQVRHEVGPGRNVVDIHKELGAAESVREPIMQPTGHTDGIISAVVDENLAGHGNPGSPRKTQKVTAGPVKLL